VNLFICQESEEFVGSWGGKNKACISASDYIDNNTTVKDRTKPFTEMVPLRILFVNSHGKI